MISIREVARLAGVSPATVSRVMNGTANVNTEKKQRVLRVIEETGFKPNELARSLYKQSSRIIGAIIPTNENPFFNELTRAVEAEAYAQGYRFMICNSDSDPEKEAESIRIMSQMKADGLVVMANNENIWKELKECQLPVIVMDRQIEDHHELAHIQANHYEGGRLAAEHLLDCGCRNIVHMRGPQKYSSGRDRFRGYLDVCTKKGLSPCYVDSSYDYQEGYEAARQLLHDYPDADGIIASNDITAVAAYKYLHGAGYRVPDDIQLIGFDDVNLSWQLTPELTTIRQPVSEMGRLAAQLIIDHVEGRETEREHVFDVELIQRETTIRRQL